MMMNDKKCYQCGKPILPAPPEEEEKALRELKDNFGPAWRPEDCDVFCDDCYEKFMKGN